jgi:ATP-dependent Clp endopeptidase proteolytic subunit ClpP
MVAIGEKMKKFYSEETSVAPISCDSKDDNKLDSVSNKLYFYSGVDTASIFDFNRRLQEIDQDNVVSAIARQHLPTGGDYKLDPIYIYIQSYGGSVFAGLSAMDTILRCKSPVYTIIDGCAASAATFLSVVGKKRFITQHSFALIHQLSSKSWGTYNEMKDDMENNDKLMSIISDIYLKYTKINKKDIKDILSHDLWMSAKECEKMGLIDEII